MSAFSNGVPHLVCSVRFTADIHVATLSCPILCRRFLLRLCTCVPSSELLSAQAFFMFKVLLCMVAVGVSLSARHTSPAVHPS